MVFTVSSKAQSSWFIEVTAILKAQSSKAWYLQCSEHGIHKVTSSASSSSSKQTGDFEGPVEQSMVFPSFKSIGLQTPAQSRAQLSRAVFLKA